MKLEVGHLAAFLAKFLDELEIIVPKSALRSDRLLTLQVVSCGIVATHSPVEATAIVLARAASIVVASVDRRHVLSLLVNSAVLFGARCQHIRTLLLLYSRSLPALPVCLDLRQGISAGKTVNTVTADTVLQA